MDEMQILGRLAALEAQVLFLSQHLGVNWPPNAGPQPAGGGPMLTPAQQEIVSLARSGNKLEAIKRYRELTGCSLSDAKQAVESI